jgi:hypothetical protein
VSGLRRSGPIGSAAKQAPQNANIAEAAKVWRAPAVMIGGRHEYRLGALRAILLGRKLAVVWGSVRSGDDTQGATRFDSPGRFQDMRGR